MSQPMVPPPAGGTVSQNRTVMIILSYLGLLALIPFLVEKDDKEVQWHAKHGLVLCGVDIAVWILWTIISMVTGGLGCLAAPIFLVIFVALLVVHVICIVQGVNGKRFLIPGISQFADRF